MSRKIINPKRFGKVKMTPRCACGKVAVDTYKGQLICRDCLDPDYEPSYDVATLISSALGYYDDMIKNVDTGDLAEIYSKSAKIKYGHDWYDKHYASANEAKHRKKMMSKNENICNDPIDH